ECYINHFNAIVECSLCKAAPKLLAALREISDAEDVRATCGSGYDGNVDGIAKAAIEAAEGV
ncbi:unnamed protein product, partial [marine sediment metagenome]